MAVFRRLRKQWYVLAIILLVTGSVLSINGCQTVWKNRNPVGEPFPKVAGESLNEVPVALPDAYLGSPLLLLVGYVQETQFDLDRWTIGLVQMEFADRIVEVPTIPGAIPSLFSSVIDNGMRGGIPSEDWASVVTLYGSAAEPVVKFTGNENPNNGRIILIDKNGIVCWFWDQGFSATRLLELMKTVDNLK
jgi:hypothetical protein